MSSSQTTTKQKADLDAAVEALRSHDRFLVTTHENPDGDALGSLLGVTLALRGLGKDATMYLAGHAPLPGEYGFMSLDEPRARGAGGRGASACCSRVDCANESRIGPRPEILHRAPFMIDIDHHHDNTRFGDVNLDRPRRVVDRRGAARRAARARRGADAGDRRGALHRARHRHRPLPVLEHDAEGAAARGRARRGGRRHPPRLPGRVRERPVRQAEAARARARARTGLRGRRARRLATSCAATSRRSARPSRTARGSSTTSGRSRARSSRC